MTNVLVRGHTPSRASPCMGPLPPTPLAVSRGGRPPRTQTAALPAARAPTARVAHAWPLGARSHLPLRLPSPARSGAETDGKRGSEEHGPAWVTTRHPQSCPHRGRTLLPTPAPRRSQVYTDKPPREAGPARGRTAPWPWSLTPLDTSIGPAGPPQGPSVHPKLSLWNSPFKTLIAASRSQWT